MSVGWVYIFFIENYFLLVVGLKFN